MAKTFHVVYGDGFGGYTILKSFSSKEEADEFCMELINDGEGGAENYGREGYDWVNTMTQEELERLRRPWQRCRPSPTDELINKVSETFS